MIRIAADDVELGTGAHPAGPVTVARLGLFVGSERVADRTEVACAFIGARVDAPPVVKLFRFDGAVLARLSVADLEAARAVRAELDVPESAPRFVAFRPIDALASRTLQRVVTGVVVFALITFFRGLLPLSTEAVLVATAVAALALFRWTRRRLFVAGDDGIAITKPFSIDFVPYGALARVERNGTLLELLLYSGVTVKVNVPDPKVGEALVEHIEAHRALVDAYAPVSAAAPLARGKRTLEAWRAALPSPAKDAGPAGYRTPSERVDAETLWSVVEHPLADLSSRAGALQALAPEAEADRARLRTVAARSASPELRGVIARVVEGKDPRAALLRLERDLHDTDRYQGRA